MICFKTNDYIEYINQVAIVIKKNKDYITELDSATGDGDHWLNLNIGFEKLVEEATLWGELNYSELFQKIAMTMMSAMGGSSGVLYGSAYLAASKILVEKDYIDEELFGDVLKSWADAISDRGKAKPGDKTMLDTIYPAAEAYQKARKEGKECNESLDMMTKAAKKGAESTKDMVAVKGRASYQMDKSIGHLDPGAITMMMQLVSMANYVKEHCVM